MPKNHTNYPVGASTIVQEKKESNTIVPPTESCSNASTRISTKARRGPGTGTLYRVQLCQSVSHRRHISITLRWRDTIVQYPVDDHCRTMEARMCPHISEAIQGVPKQTQGALQNRLALLFACSYSHHQRRF